MQHNEKAYGSKRAEKPFKMIEYRQQQYEYLVYVTLHITRPK